MLAEDTFFRHTRWPDSRIVCVDIVILVRRRDAGYCSRSLRRRSTTGDQRVIVFVETVRLFGGTRIKGDHGILSAILIHVLGTVRAVRLAQLTPNAALVIVHGDPVIGFKHCLGRHRARLNAGRIGTVVAQDRANRVFDIPCGKGAFSGCQEIGPIILSAILFEFSIILCFAGQGAGAATQALC